MLRLLRLPSSCCSRAMVMDFFGRLAVGVAQDDGIVPRLRPSRQLAPLVAQSRFFSKHRLRLIPCFSRSPSIKSSHFVPSFSLVIFFLSQIMT